jgi:hypothetical protein
VPDAQQANVVSFPGVAGKWLTLSTGSGLAFKSVVPGVPPNLELAPAVWNQQNVVTNDATEASRYYRLRRY